MGMDDVFSTQSAVVAAATAAVVSPKTRERLRQGAVYGLAGVLKAGDVAAGAARGLVRGVRGSGDSATGSEPAGGAAAATTPSRPAAGGSSRSRRTTSGTASARRAAATRKAAGSNAGS